MKQSNLPHTSRKKNNKEDKRLSNDIEFLENIQDQTGKNSKLLEDKRLELQKLRENKVKGQMVRAHLQWLDQGEKPTSFFCKLETKNYVDKTIKRIQTPDGSIITEQSKILQKVQEFYSKLFENKDNSLKSMATSKIPELQYFKKNDSSNLGGEITTHELGKALKKMKNNKSPGIDGISADF